MHTKLILTLILGFILSFFLNYINHHNLLVSLANSLTFISSISLFKDYLSSNLFRNFFILSLAFIPLFHYKPDNQYLSFLPLIGILILSLHRYPKIIFLWVFFLFIGNLFMGEVIKYPFNIQETQLIINSPEINYNIQRHREDALYTNYKIRQIIYSDSVFIYSALANFFNFLTLKNISDILLIANLYPLFLGLLKVVKEKQFKNLFLTSFLILLISAGVDRSPDKFQSLYLLSPLFILLIILGSQKINKKIYFALFALSIFIFISPKI